MSEKKSEMPVVQLNIIAKYHILIEQ